MCLPLCLDKPRTPPPLFPPRKTSRRRLRQLSCWRLHAYLRDRAALAPTRSAVVDIPLPPRLPHPLDALSVVEDLPETADAAGKEGAPVNRDRLQRHRPPGASSRTPNEEALSALH